MLRLAWFKALAELQVEASRRYLGVLVWVVEPVLYMAAFYFVFAVGLRMGGPDYLPFLLCGLVPWKWFSTTVRSGANVVAENKALMNQVYFHKSMLIWMLLIANLLKALMVFVLFMLALILMGYAVTSTWLAVPVVLLAQLVIMAGIVAVTASVVPFLPDLRMLIDNGILVLLFVSGIFFDISQRSAHIQELLYLNPVAVIVTAYRSVLLYDTWPQWPQLMWVIALGIMLLLLGMRLIDRFDRAYPKVAL